MTRALNRRLTQRQRKETTSRIWSRLVSKPFCMSQAEIAKLWGVTPAYVCMRIKEIRYETPGVAA
jgi:hypothetical protein